MQLGSIELNSLRGIGDTAPGLSKDFIDALTGCIAVAGVDLLVEGNGRFGEGWGLRDLNALWVQLGVLPEPTSIIHP